MLVGVGRLLRVNGRDERDHHEDHGALPALHRVLIKRETLRYGEKETSRLNEPAE